MSADAEAVVEDAVDVALEAFAVPASRGNREKVRRAVLAVLSRVKHFEIRGALEGMVSAETKWLAERSGMGPDFFDDPLGDAYRHALNVLAEPMR